ncbi:hypothetical protein [Chitinophaga ginsengisegetis]|uniref:hypothetical protein n=1 Tax=Chitinophaga ginsengisegetis TaxID=393003 RepID=UPI000DBA65D1|nr:hypothetical protein [Chitinophaga ginsengisegetis]MDR6568836.1 hypothetical protein [Chitinophaga ginsengisegetis]MDR6649134.1 hypothetical protein [Chitinophaga ginsengisegetis]MDR6654917.1 hypothetical protein [Chitinophaga ginsengisegetis]
MKLSLLNISAWSFEIYINMRYSIAHFFKEVLERNAKSQLVKKAVLFSLLTVTVNDLIAQNKDVQSVVGPSPNMTSLFKFNDQPISLYTGTNQVNIPVYTVKQGRIELPIALMYHSGGIKVTESASWVGLGWALNAGGAITQLIYGRPDIPTTTIGPKYNNPSTLDKCVLTSILSGVTDSQPDIYQFNFAGVSGSFYLNDSNIIHQLPYSRIRIERVFDLPGIGLAWRLTNTDGISYLFTKPETVVSTGQSVTNSNGMNTGGGTVPGPWNPYTVSSNTWHLTQIASPDGDTVSIDYDIYYCENQNFIGETNFYAGNGNSYTKPPNITNYELQRINGWRIRQINMKNGSVKFIAGGNRCDALEDKYLSEIQVVDSVGHIIKREVFNYRYLVENTWFDLSQINCDTETRPSMSSVDVSRNCLRRRLMLTRIDEVTSLTGQATASYKLEYENAFGLPSRFSSQQDYWGYYNGNGKYALLQTLQASTSDYQGINVPFIMGRDPNLLYAKQGTLSKITYPTGGSSAFTYELNTVRRETSNGCGNLLAIPTRSFSLSANVDGQLIGSFVVNHCSGGVTLTFQVDGCFFTDNMSLPTILPFGFNIIKSGTVYVTSQNIITQSNGHAVTGAGFYLPNGTYSIYSYSTSGPPCTYSLTIPGRNEPQFIAATNQYEKVVGGIRIKQILNEDPVGNTTSIKTYEYTKTNNGITASSGSVSDPLEAPFNNCYVTGMDASSTQDNVFYTQGTVYPLLTLNSNTNYPLRMTHGAQVGYSQVTEKTIDGSGNDIGATVYTFSTPGDESFQSPTVLPSNLNGNVSVNDGGLYPFAPSFSNEWQRGLLLSKSEYRNTGSGSYSLVKSEQNVYSDVKILDTTYGVVAAYYLDSKVPYFSECTPGSGNRYKSYSIFKYTPYRIYSKYATLDATIVSQTDNNGNIITDTTWYGYTNGYLQAGTVKRLNAKNEIVTLNNKYPYDYIITGTPSNPIATGIKKLQELNITTPVVESYIQVSGKDGSNLRTTAGTFTTFKSAIAHPDVAYQLEIPAPVSNFSPAGISAGSSSFDTRYKPNIIFDTYDASGNLLQQHKADDQVHAYIWDYNAMYPVAEATNALSTNICYTSFETAARGNWIVSGGSVNNTGGLTGNNSYVIGVNNTISKMSLPLGDYIVSYWTKGAALSVNGVSAGIQTSHNGWNYYEQKLSGVTSVSISGIGTLDELRLYPAGAEMKTYTYAPLVGMTSQTGPDNRTIYYEYDNLSRLRTLRDQDGKILKQFDYEYQKPINQ